MNPFRWNSKTGKTNLCRKMNAVLGNENENWLIRMGMRQLSGVMVTFYILKGVWIIEMYLLKFNQSTLKMCVSLYTHFRTNNEQIPNC